MNLLMKKKKNKNKKNKEEKSLSLVGRDKNLSEIEGIEEKSPSLVGRDKNLSKIEGILLDDRISFIGVCGMAGVGKTALMNAAAESVSTAFDQVIRATVGRSWNVRQIQEDIGNHWRPSFHFDKFQDPRRLINNLLMGPIKFLLVLDDIPSMDGIMSNLDSIGIPRFSVYNSKIVLITRCPQHGEWFWRARIVELGFLGVESSWELFRRELGRDVDPDHPSIRPLAETVVAKCGGLPLALIEVAKAMAHARTPPEWEDAVKILNESPSRHPGMEDFLRTLRTDHFDQLEDETKQCLLYCSLFPEDHRISTYELGDLWVAKGLVDENSFSSSSSSKISKIIHQLTNECLLIWDGYRHVKMHSTVRLMAYWLTSDDGPYSRQTTDLSLGEGMGRSLKHVTDQIETWSDAKKFRLMFRLMYKEMGERRLPGGTPCRFPHLRTLLLSSCNCSYLFLRNLFVHTPVLQCLNLSDANIMEELPSEIGSLVNLEYLNLSRTGIRELPATIGGLVKLRHLHLRQTRRLSSIPAGTIEYLAQLRTLDLFQSGFRRINLRDLPFCLPALETLGLSSGGADWLESLVKPDQLGGQLHSSEPRRRAHKRFVNRLRFLELSNIPGLITERLSAYLLNLSELRQLSVVGPCPELQELRLESLQCSLWVLHLSCLQRARTVKANLPDLFELHIDNCHRFRDLSWVGQLRSLQYIRLADCNGLEELIVIRVDYIVELPRLKKMSLCRLPRLRSISRGPLHFDGLEELEVSECPNLTALLFHASAADTIRRFVGEQDWWDKLTLSWYHDDGFGKRVRREIAFCHYFQPLATATGEKGVDVLHRLGGSSSAEHSGEKLHESAVSLKNEGKEKLEEIESYQQGGEKLQEGVGSHRRKKGKEKLEEIESFLPEEEGELTVRQEPSSDEAGSDETDELPSPLVIEGKGSIARLHKDEDPPLNEQNRGIPHESTVSLSKIGKEKFEEGARSLTREQGMSKLQADEEFVGEQGDITQTVYTAQTHQGEGFANEPLDSEKLQKNTDNLVYVEGQEETLSTIREYLQNDGVGVIGLQGVGGVGKTTLLKKLNSEFCSKQDSGFDVVIMITASKYFHHKKKIQKEIGEKLGLSLSAGGTSFLEDMQATILHQALSQKKFLLIVDGAQAMDWDKIGIPLPDEVHRRKIIFATEGCEDMTNVEIIKMKSLNDFESWELFSREIKDEAMLENQNIKPLAKQVVAKCEGLPLALTIVGRAMSNKKAEQDWQDAREKLDGLAKDFQDREQDMHYALRFSYDYLQDDTLRFCLLYCSLFPENHSIGIEELIQYWFGEGLLHDSDIDSAHDAGHTVIEQLRATFLLEDGSDKENEVRMHNVVRELVLQLTSSAHEQSNIFLVYSGRGLTYAPEAEKWRQATRISLMHNELEILPSKILKCPKLSTLLLNKNTSLKQIPKNFFKYMPTLCVLDLSYTGIEELPKALGLLSKLQFLSLSHTSIKSIPKELGNLVQLRQLDLSYMSSLTNIPQRAILKLSKLQILNLYNTSQWSSQEPGHGKQKGACIQDLKNLDQLKDLSLTIKSLLSLVELQNNSNLLSMIRSLGLIQVEDLTSNLISDILGRLEKLQVFQISEASQLEKLQFPHNQVQCLEVISLEHLPLATFIVDESLEYLPFQKLHRLHITGCHGFKDLNWVHLVPSLEYIELRVCYGIKEIAMGDGAKEEIIKNYSFPRLKIMHLWDLPRLERISTSSLFLPFLEYLEVFYCPKLKKLPLTAESAKKIKDICGHQEWWDGLEWDHQSVKANFLRHFKDPRNQNEMTGQLRLMGSNY